MTSRHLSGVAGLVGAAALCAAAGSPVQAQEAWSLPTEWQVGAVGIVAPKYEGSNSYRVLGAPFIAPAGLSGGDGWLQVKGPDDVRFRLLKQSGFELGPVLGWRFGRDEEDGNRLAGLGDVEGGLVVGGFAAYRMGILAAFASYQHQVTGDDTGGQLRFGLEAKSKINPWLTLTGVAGSTWSSNDYMDAFFSVSPGQSVTSGLTRFDAESGIKDVYLGLGAEVPLDARWTLTMSGKYSRLVGDAADSPIVESENQLTGMLGLSYRFSIGR